jgi:hypothetical protein
MLLSPSFVSRSPFARWGFAGVAAVALLGGCASRQGAPSLSPTPGAASSSELRGTLASADGDRPRHIVAVHRSKCGACHTPVSPGSVPRGEAEAAMRRHRHRAKLSEREWNDMVEYISDDGDLRGQPTARLP